MPLTRKLASKSLIKQNTNQDVIGTGVTNLVRDAFTGTGSQIAFALTTAPLSAANTQVFISGVYQNKNTYTISGATLTFTTPPPNATTVEVISGTNYSIGVPGDSTVTAAKIVDNNVTATKLDTTAINLILPSGCIIPYAGNPGTAPTGYLYCDGNSYSTSLYPALFAAIGYTYGGSGATFNVPDTRGIFLRGAGTNPSNSSNTTTIGTRQLDDFKSHTHASTRATTPDLGAGAAGTTFYSSGGSSGTTGSAGGTETRPANLGINYIIKT